MVFRCLLLSTIYCSIKSFDGFLAFLGKNILRDVDQKVLSFYLEMGKDNKLLKTEVDNTLNIQLVRLFHLKNAISCVQN